MPARLPLTDMILLNTSWVSLFPEAASTFARDVDLLYFYWLTISLIFSIPIVFAIFTLGLRYREKEKFARTPEIHGSAALEVTWSVIPLMVAMSIFLGGAIVYYNQYTPPTEGMDIYLVGKQWMWKAQHLTGQREINELHVPVNTNIKLTMTTEDVIHDFDVPAFRTKADVVPGRYTYMWFNATKPGKYRIFCAEYCGLNHSGMVGWVYVMEQRDFDAWLSGNTSGQTPVEAGRDLFDTKLGCASCHTGTSGARGPNLTGLFDSKIKLSTGESVTADDNYIRNSILNPASQVVEGFQPIMPTFKGQVTEEQLNSLVAYVKSLSPNAGQTPAASSSETKPAAANATTAADDKTKGNTKK